MKYSRWRPSKGGYDVFEDSGEVDLGNDMPTPMLIGYGPIGVPSVEIGRKPAGTVRAVGTSSLPVGSVMSTKSGPLSGFPDIPGGTDGMWMLAAGGFIGWVVCSMYGRK
jgi:hypothetical protein